MNVTPKVQRGSASHGPTGSCSATTMIELLASMAILSIILLVLASALEVSLGRFRRGVDRSEGQSSAHEALQWLGRDLSAAAASRSAPTPRLPAASSPEQEAFFANRILFPFEIDRSQGEGIEASRSFSNAAPEFGSLAFPAALPASGGFEDRLVGLVGYYVAYTRDSPLADDTNMSMKLFRHLRPGGAATGYLASCSELINDAWDEGSSGGARPLDQTNPAAVRRGRFANAQLPFLFASRIEPGNPSKDLPTTSAWPLYPDPTRLADPPPSLNPFPEDDIPKEGSSADLDDVVYPDEAVCEHVVRFELKPYHWITLSNGTQKIADAHALNQHLGLGGGGEWPCLVTPDFIDLTLGVVDAQTARRLPKYEDWIVDWTNETPSTWTPTRKLIEQTLRTHRVRLKISPAST